MALKPLTINNGQIEQLASGQALDVGGWNLPTAGGTENYVLVANVSGHAVWSSSLVGLTNLTVDNININGAVITSDTGAISFSNENLSTSGTVVGSNIPSPSVDDQVLISTASGVSNWSTAGNNQYLASSGSGEVAWANNLATMVNPTEDDQLLVATGAGTASWTTTLDILTVDNITINGAVISSDTDTISFDDENLITTGDFTVGRVTSWRDNSGGADAAGIFTRFQSGGGIPNSVIRVIFEEDSAGEGVLIDGTGPAIQFENKNEEEATNIIAKIAARRREDDDSSGSLDFYTYSGGVATCGGRFNPDGSFTLLEGLDVTGGPVVGSNVPSPTVDDQVLISTAADTASWSTAGNDQYLASDGGGEVAWANKPAAMAQPSADNQLLESTGSGTAAWTDTLDILKVDDITIDGAVITSDTDAISFDDENLSTSGTMVGSNIPSPSVDDQVLISTASGIASWSTAGNDQYLASDGAGEVAWIAKPILASNPTTDDQVLISTGEDAASWSTAGNDQILASDGSGEVAWTNKSFGDTIPANSAQYEVYVGTGIGTAAWTTDLVGLTSLAVESSAWAASTFTRTTTNTTGIGVTANFMYKTSGNAADGFGGGIVFSLADDSAGQRTLVGLFGTRTGADDSGTLHFYTNNAGSFTSKARISPAGEFTVDGALNAGSLTIDNITIDGAVITSDTDAISFDDENLTTTGTMVGTNIPSPSVDDQVLISTASGIASWSTAGNDQYLASDGAGEVAWADKSFGNNIPANSSQYEVYVGTGEGTASWTTDLAGLTSLTVDNININAAVITSDTGAISFGDEDLTTTGSITTNKLTSTYSTMYTDGAATAYHGLITEDQSGSVSGTCVIDLPVGFLRTTMNIRITGYNRSSIGAWSVLVGGYPYYTTDDIWINHHASIQGNPPFTSVRLGWNGNTSKACIMLGVTDSSWVDPIIHVAEMIAGNQNRDNYQSGWAINWYEDESNFVDQSGYEDPVTVATNQDFVSPASSGKILVSTGSKKAAWTTDLTSLTSLTVDNITIDGAVITSDTDAISFDDENLTTTGTMVGTNIPSPTVDDQVLISTASGVASWSTAGNDQYLASNGAGEVAWADKSFGNSIPANSAQYQIYVGTGVGTAAWTTDLAGLTSLTVDNININGAVITSDTGAISFGDEDLTTTGTMVGTNIPSPTVDDQVLISTGEDAASWSTAGNDQYLASDDAGEVAWADKPAAMAQPSADDQLLVATGEDAASWTDTLDILKVDNITIDGAVITSDTDAISFDDENLTSTGTIVGKNIPSPSASGKALVSTATDTATWYTTSLYDVLKVEVPSASGAERKFVLTADPGSQFEIESAPWTLMLSSDETVYVRTGGNDTIGDGSEGAPFLTLTRTIEYIGGLYIGDYNVIVDIGEGVFAEAGTLTFMHPFGAQVTFTGVSEQITSQDTDSISGSGTTLGHSNLYWYDVTFILPIGKSVSVGDYIAVREVSGGTLSEALYGCHYVSGWDGGSRTATVQVVYRDGAPKASGTVTCTVELIKTVIAFDNKTGLKVTGPYFGGIWKGLVIQGNYDDSNTNAKYGVWSLNTGVASLAVSDSSGYAVGIVGFKTGLYAQNNALIFADYSFVSKCGLRCASAQNGGILNLRFTRLSGANNNGIFAFGGSTVTASNTKIVAVGSDSILSYQGSFIDAQNSYIDQNNATYSFKADRWAAIDATGATESDGVSPVTDGNNDGSYIIGI